MPARRSPPVLSLSSDVNDVLGLPGLPGPIQQAVASTVDIGRAVSGFRNRLYHMGHPEKDGDLYDLVLLLYVGQLLESGEEVALKKGAYIRQVAHRVRTGSLQDALKWLRIDDARDEVWALAASDYFLKPDKSKLAERNPYVKAIDSAKCARIAELDFLTEEHGFDANVVNARPGLQTQKLSDEEIILFLHALHGPEAPLAKLMRPLRFLTHHENVSVAVQHARLGLLESELRVVLGMDITYADLKRLVEPCHFLELDKRDKIDAAWKWRVWRKQLLDRIDNPDRLPSGTETGLRLRTISLHELARTQGGRVVHDSSAACPDTAPLFVKRMLRLHSPDFVAPGEKARDWTHRNELLEYSKEENNPGDVVDDCTYQQWELEESKEAHAILMRA